MDLVYEEEVVLFNSNPNIFVIQALYAIEYIAAKDEREISSFIKELASVAGYIPKGFLINKNTLALDNLNLELEAELEIRLADEVSRIYGILTASIEIDSKIIKRLAPNWRINRLAIVVLCILRAAVYDITLINKNDKDLSSIGTIISNYLQIAKMFGHYKEIAFINGILDKIAQDEFHEATSELQEHKNTVG